MSNFEYRHLCGWRGVDATQRAFARQFSTLRRLAPQLWKAHDDSQPVLLYKAFREVLGGDPDYPAQQIGDCLVAGSIVLGETIKPIEQVQVGDAVWTGQGRLTKVVSTRAIETMKPLVKIRTKGGLPTTCTMDHLCLAYRVPVVSGKRATKQYYERTVSSGENRSAVIAAYEAIAPEWIPAGELTDDHYLLAPVNCEPAATPDDAYLAKLWETVAGRRMLGYFVGDGCARGGSVEFCVSEPETSAELIATLTGMGFNLKFKEYKRISKAWAIRVHSTELVRCLRRHFYDASGAKVFPGWAIGAASFIDGLYEADGCDTREEKSLSSTSLSVVNGLLGSLRRLGANPIVIESSRSAGTYANAKPLYVIKWSDDRKKNVIWRDENFVCHRVKSIEFIEGPSTVYDIGVEDEHHSFIANGYTYHNCVSFGHSHGNDLSQCVEIALGDDAEFQQTDTEFIYGAAREVANMLGPEDGCYGSAAVKAMTTIGMISRPMLGADGAYSGKRAKSWGMNGAPQELKDAAAEYKLGAVANVTTWDELVAAMQSGYPVTICTGQGFVMTRDEQGFCSPSGTWGHCMCLGGLRFDRPGACVLQSWGRMKPSGPTDLDQPDWSFWVDRNTISRILAEGDSWALSKSPAFKKRDLPKWSYDIAA